MKYIAFILVGILLFLIYKGRSGRAASQPHAPVNTWDPKNLYYAIPPTPAQAKTFAINSYGYLAPPRR